MRFPERRATRPSRSPDRYGAKPGPSSGGSNEPLHVPADRSNADPVGMPAPASASAPAPAPVTPRPVGRTDLTRLLGRSVLEARVQEICHEYGLLPHSGLARSYLSRESGVEVAADAHGTVTAVLLHFHGDDGFTAYQGELPGGAGGVPRRTPMWSVLGRPDESGDAYRDRFLGDYGPWDRWILEGLALHAQYATDAETLNRITLTLPDRLPRAA